MSESSIPVRPLPPYGRSNFFKLRTGNFAYVDKTRHLRLLEQYPNPYQIFLRPRRFGKSLWLSTLRHHYDLLHRERWEQLFAGLDAGREPSPLRSSFRVLEFDFSGIPGEDREEAKEGMRQKVIRGVEMFLRTYGPGTDRDIRYTRELSTAANVLSFGLQLASQDSAPVCVLIDEYDHFTNQLLTHDRLDFLEAVEHGGFVRTFFEVLKEGTKSCVERIFLTGVTPVTLDSLTSGFNIADNLTLLPQLHDLLGFTEPEVEQLLASTLGLDPAEQAHLLEELSAWYDGYSFVPGADQLFNPEMVLYYIKERLIRGTAPPVMLDSNIATDHRTIERTLNLGDRAHNSELLQQIVEQGQTGVALTRQHSLRAGFTSHDFGSLLFYLGFLTCRGQEGDRYLLGIPNRVIGELHWRMLLTIVLERAGLDAGRTAQILADAVHALGFGADPHPLLEQVSLLLQKRISNRDLMNFDEKHLKMIFLSFLSASDLYLVLSEPEIERGYVDLLLVQRPAIPVDWEHAFELKYLRSKASEAEVEAKVQEGELQLRGYLDSRALGERGNMVGWVVVFRGGECVVVKRM